MDSGPFFKIDFISWKRYGFTIDRVFIGFYCRRCGEERGRSTKPAECCFLFSLHPLQVSIKNRNGESCFWNSNNMENVTFSQFSLPCVSKAKIVPRWIDCTPKTTSNFSERQRQKKWTSRKSTLQTRKKNANESELRNPPPPPSDCTKKK